VKLYKLASDQVPGILECPGWAYRVTFSSDGKLLAAIAYTEPNVHEVKLWDMTSGKELHAFEAGSMAFSPDSRLLAVGTRAKTVRLFDLASGQDQCILEGHPDRMFKVTFSPDGRRLLSVGGDTRVWDVASGRLLFTHRGQRADSFFNRDGTRLISNSNPGLQVWHAETGDLLCTMLSRGHATAVDPEGWQIAVGVEPQVTIYDVRPLTPELRLQREAHHLVAALLNRPMLKPRPPLLKAEVMARLRDLKTISDEV